jgi:uncharacterized caspase-like protein
MKLYLVFLLLFGMLPLAAQTTQNSTRAVIIGISDYQSPEIPDLRFAHNDATAFADWLKSPDGLQVDSNQIRMLTNRDATVARVVMALDWLIEESEAGDRVIIYFAGHVAADTKTKRSRGYLLCFDAPPAFYATGGSLPFMFLEDILVALSEKGASVLFIGDVAHSGNPGDDGTALEAYSRLMLQSANETRILSCQAGEISLEGEQWGGGRSAFSWHLVNGLCGQADEDRDGRITLFEITRYLEKNVTMEVAPYTQNPITIGNRNAVIIEKKQP